MRAIDAVTNPSARPYNILRLDVGPFQADSEGTILSSGRIVEECYALAPEGREVELLEKRG